MERLRFPIKVRKLGRDWRSRHFSFSQRPGVAPAWRGKRECPNPVEHGIKGRGSPLEYGSIFVLMGKTRRMELGGEGSPLTLKVGLIREFLLAHVVCLRKQEAIPYWRAFLRSQYTGIAQEETSQGNIDLGDFCDTKGTSPWSDKQVLAARANDKYVEPVRGSHCFVQLTNAGMFELGALALPLDAMLFSRFLKCRH